MLARDDRWGMKTGESIVFPQGKSGQHSDMAADFYPLESYWIVRDTLPKGLRENREN